MPVFDTTFVVGGFSQIISDWAIGDDRQFSGDVLLSPNPPPPTDEDLSDAYFTLKQVPTSPDAQSTIQKHITQTSSAAGQITAGTGGHKSQLLIKIASGDYENSTSAISGPQYSCDIRCITTGGVTFTVAIGTMRFVQNDTQASEAGQPAAIPNQGNPVFRGFIDALPSGIPGLKAIFNAGDWYMNSNPANGNGVLFQCTIGGAPGTWIAVFPGGIVPPSNDPHFLGYSVAAPLSGTFQTLDYYLNAAPAAGQAEGWVCIAGGTPGTWRTKGIIGDSSGV